MQEVSNTKIVFIAVRGLVKKENWAQLFKTNDVNSYIVKKLIIKYDIYANIFAEKNVSSFCKNTRKCDTVLNRIVII